MNTNFNSTEPSILLPSILWNPVHLSLLFTQQITYLLPHREKKTGTIKTYLHLHQPILTEISLHGLRLTP